MALLTAGTGTATVAAAAETAVVTTPIDTSTNEGSSGLIVWGTVSYTTTSAAGTATSARVRQGTGTGGTQVGPTFTVTQATGSANAVSFCVIDTAPLVAQVYTATVQITSNATSIVVTGTASVLNLAGVLQ